MERGLPPARRGTVTGGSAKWPAGAVTALGSGPASGEHGRSLSAAPSVIARADSCPRRGEQPSKLCLRAYWWAGARAVFPRARACPTSRPAVRRSRSGLQPTWRASAVQVACSADSSACCLLARVLSTAVDHPHPLRRAERAAEQPFVLGDLRGRPRRRWSRCVCSTVSAALRGRRRYRPGRSRSPPERSRRGAGAFRCATLPGRSFRRSSCDRTARERRACATGRRCSGPCSAPGRGCAAADPRPGCCDGRTPPPPTPPDRPARPRPSRAATARRGCPDRPGRPGRRRGALPSPRPGRRVSQSPQRPDALGAENVRSNPVTPSVRHARPSR